MEVDLRALMVYIVIAGGGSYLFKKTIREAFPQYRLQEVSEPMYANVRGYQIAGEAKVASKADTDVVVDGATGIETGETA